MENSKYFADLIIDYGKTFYGPKTPEYMASQWVKALPKASLSDSHEWFDLGFWDPDIAKSPSDAGVSPRGVRSDTAYDLCNGDLPVATFLRARRY